MKNVFLLKNLSKLCCNYGSNYCNHYFWDWKKIYITIFNALNIEKKVLYLNHIKRCCLRHSLNLYLQRTSRKCGGKVRVRAKEIERGERDLPWGMKSWQRLFLFHFHHGNPILALAGKGTQGGESGAAWWRTGGAKTVESEQECNKNKRSRSFIPHGWCRTPCATAFARTFSFPPRCTQEGCCLGWASPAAASASFLAILSVSN